MTVQGYITAYRQDSIDIIGMLDGILALEPDMIVADLIIHIQEAMEMYPDES